MNTATRILDGAYPCVAADTNSFAVGALRYAPAPLNLAFGRSRKIGGVVKGV